jgi:hypothetical protein
VKGKPEKHIGLLKKVWWQAEGIPEQRINPPSDPGNTRQQPNTNAARPTHTLPDTQSKESRRFL